MELLRIFRYFFFRSADVKSWGCVLYAGAPYTRDFTVNLCEVGRAENEVMALHQGAEMYIILDIKF